MQCGKEFCHEKTLTLKFLFYNLCYKQIRFHLFWTVLNHVMYLKLCSFHFYWIELTGENKNIWWTLLLQIREDVKKGIYVENLKEIEVASARDMLQQLIQVCKLPLHIVFFKAKLPWEISFNQYCVLKSPSVSDYQNKH